MRPRYLFPLLAALLAVNAAAAFTPDPCGSDPKRCVFDVILTAHPNDVSTLAGLTVQFRRTGFAGLAEQCTFSPAGVCRVSITTPRNALSIPDPGKYEFKWFSDGTDLPMVRATYAIDGMKVFIYCPGRVPVDVQVKRNGNEQDCLGVNWAGGQ